VYITKAVDFDEFEGNIKRRSERGHFSSSDTDPHVPRSCGIFLFMKQQSNRVQFLDLMRGFAVIVMVMGHSIDSVLSFEVRSTPGFRLYDVMRGFTAPMFLFVSGFAYMVATDKKWDELRVVGRPAVKRLTRIGLLFVVGYALHLPFLSFEKLLTQSRPEDLAQFFQADVLHCMAVSLLILQLTLFVAPTKRSFAFAILSVGAVIILVSPWVWSIDFAPILSPMFAPYFNQIQPSLFPIFPFASFLFLGVVVGHFYLEARKNGVDGVFSRRLWLLAFASLALGIAFDLFPFSVYPAHDYWKPSPAWFLVRTGIVALVSILFYSIKRLPTTIEKNLVLLGQASLLIYTVHLIVVYGSAANFGLRQTIGQTLSPHYAIAVGTLVLFCMLLLMYAWNYLRRNHFVPARMIQLGLAGSFVYNLLIRQ
jgi:acyltransferase